MCTGGCTVGRDYRLVRCLLRRCRVFQVHSMLRWFLICQLAATSPPCWSMTTGTIIHVHLPPSCLTSRCLQVSLTVKPLKWNHHPMRCLPQLNLCVVRSEHLDPWTDLIYDSVCTNILGWEDCCILGVEC